MNEVQIFSNPEFGAIRTLTIDDEPWFVGRDVARALGYTNTRDALQRHVDDADKNTVAIHDGIVGNPNATIINESGLYSLIFSSKLDSAKQFKHWVTSEVLPTIRKTGKYELVPADPAEAVINTDYLRAADIASKCHRDRLSLVMDLLRKSGLDVSQPELYGLKKPPRGSVKIGDEEMEHLVDLLSQPGMTCLRVENDLGICKATISMYRRGIRRPTPERYTQIINFYEPVEDED